MHKNKIVILAGPNESADIIYNTLKDDFNIVKVIREKGVSKKILIKKRIKRLGFWRVLGQIGFILHVALWLKIISRGRIMKIKSEHNLVNTAIDESIIARVSSVNSDKSITVLKEFNPDIVILSGTRIVSEKVLNSVNVKFINLHAGITPAYRGSHGAYWALVNNDKEHCGVTVHLVDKGIDTGGILYQKLIHPTKKDNFITYQYLQLTVGIPILKKAIRDIENNVINVKKSEGSSGLYSHPTLFGYMWGRFKKGVK